MECVSPLKTHSTVGGVRTTAPLRLNAPPGLHGHRRAVLPSSKRWQDCRDAVQLYQTWYNGDIVSARNHLERKLWMKSIFQNIKGENLGIGLLEHNALTFHWEWAVILVVLRHLCSFYLERFKIICRYVLCLQFWPDSGPTKGGTKVTISGHQFGNATAATNIKATVALEDCAIDFSNATQ